MSVEFIGGQRSVVYLVKNKVTGKMYVGQTTYSLKERWRHHRKGKSEYGGLLCDAIQDLGEDAFSIEELESTQDTSQLDALETWYIAKYNTLTPHGYNQTPGGHVFKRGAQHADRIALSKTQITFVTNPKPMWNQSRKVRKGQPAHRKKAVIGTNCLTGQEIRLEYMSADPQQFDPRLISACCRGKRHYHRGHSWRYADGPTLDNC